MRYIFIVMSCLLASQGFGQLIVDDPNAEARSVGDYKSISVSGGIDLWLTRGTAGEIAVSNGRSGRNDDVVTEVKDGVLKIHMASDLRNFRSRSRPRVYAAYHILEKLTISGACDVRFADTVFADRLLVKLDGASELVGEIRTPRLEVDLSGASDVSLAGSADELKVKCSGASDFKSYGLVAGRCDADISGASEAQITVRDALTVRASGASNLTYNGTPTVSVKVTGASTVSRRD